jgi:hypothetical protein
LKNIHDEIQILVQKRKCALDSNILYDKLFAHFFSTHRPNYFSENIHCFLTLISDEAFHVPQSVLAFYLKITLKSHCSSITWLGFDPQVGLLS